MARYRTKPPPEGAPAIAPVLATNLIRRRTAMALSQQAAADLIQIPRKQLSKLELESANPTLLTLEKIAAFYGMSLSDMLRELPELHRREPPAKRPGRKIKSDD